MMVQENVQEPVNFPVHTLQVPCPPDRGFRLHYLPEGLLRSAPSLGAISPLTTPHPKEG